MYLPGFKMTEKEIGNGEYDATRWTSPSCSDPHQPDGEIHRW